MQPQVEHMLEKLEHLSPNVAGESRDFIDFSNQRIRTSACGRITHASLRGHLQSGMGQRRRCHLTTPNFGDGIGGSIHQLANHKAAARGDHQP